MRDRTRKPRMLQAENSSQLKTPQWGVAAPAQVVFRGYGKLVSSEQREAELTRFIGYMTAQGWTQIHRRPGAVLLAQTHQANGGTALVMGATGVATGTTMAGIGLAGALAGIGTIFLGLLLTITIIGAVIGIPMIAAGAAVFTGGATAATAGGVIGAGGMAVGISGAASHDQTLRVQAWIDETGRIFTKGA